MGFEKLVQGNVVGAYNAYYNDINPAPFCLLVNLCGAILAMLRFQLPALAAFALGVGASTTQVRRFGAAAAARDRPRLASYSSCFSMRRPIQTARWCRNGSSPQVQSRSPCWPWRGHCSRVLHLRTGSLLLCLLPRVVSTRKQCAYSRAGAKRRAHTGIGSCRTCAAAWWTNSYRISYGAGGVGGAFRCGDAARVAAAAYPSSSKVMFILWFHGLCLSICTCRGRPALAKTSQYKGVGIIVSHACPVIQSPDSRNYL